MRLVVGRPTGMSRARRVGIVLPIIEVCMDDHEQPGSTARISGTPGLMASYFTIAGNVVPMSEDWTSPHSLDERAAAAKRAGYVGIGLSIDDLERCIGRHGHAGVRAILADNGIEYLELEVLLDWFAEGPRRAASDATRLRLLDVAEKLGVYQVKVGGEIDGTDWPLEHMANAFHDLCREAEGVGLQICIEVSPLSNIRDLPTGIAIVQGAGAANGGLLLDIWHMVRGNIPFDDIAAMPPGCLKHVELNDAARQVEGALLEDTIRRRTLPGEGDFDIPAFLTVVASTGYQGLYGVEILSDAQRALAPAEAARRSYDATMRQFELTG